MSQLELAANFFEERIVQETALGGSTVFIQRPKATAEGAVQSAADLPDDFDVSTIGANSTQLYRISIGPVDIVINYDAANFGAEIKVKINVPILGSITIAHAQGNIKQGLSLNVGYKGIASGSVGLKLDGNKVVLYWDVSAFGNSFKDEIVLFSI